MAVANIEPMARTVLFIHKRDSIARMQLAPAGRKPSAHRPWSGHGTGVESVCKQWSVPDGTENVRAGTAFLDDAAR
jgi:hypothetical protein